MTKKQLAAKHLHKGWKLVTESADGKVTFQLKCNKKIIATLIIPLEVE